MDPVQNKISKKCPCPPLPCNHLDVSWYYLKICPLLHHRRSYQDYGRQIYISRAIQPALCPACHLRHLAPLIKTCPCLKCQTSMPADSSDATSARCQASKKKRPSRVTGVPNSGGKPSRLVLRWAMSQSHHFTFIACSEGKSVCTSGVRTHGSCGWVLTNKKCARHLCNLNQPFGPLMTTSQFCKSSLGHQGDRMYQGHMPLIVTDEWLATQIQHRPQGPPFACRQPRECKANW